MEPRSQASTFPVAWAVTSCPLQTCQLERAAQALTPGGVTGPSLPPALPPSLPGFKGAAERLLQLSQSGGPEADVQGPGDVAGGWRWGIMGPHLWGSGREGLAGDQSLVRGPGQGAWDRNAGSKTQEKGREHGIWDEDPVHSTGSPRAPDVGSKTADASQAAASWATPQRACRGLGLLRGQGGVEALRRQGAER